MTRYAVEGEVTRGSLVVLRTKRLGDAPNDFRWRTDPELARFDAARPFGGTYNEFLSLYRDELNYPSPYRRSLAIETLDGRHIGNVMYYNIDQVRSEAELGITIGERDYWSSGFGADTVRTLTGYLFEQGGLQRVHLKTLEWNQRARKCFENAGFQECGRNRRGGNNFILMETWHNEAPGNGPDRPEA